jgi:hypothetical protein
MVFKGIYKAKYTLAGKLNELIVKVELLQREGLVPAGKNLWYGVATVNDQPYEDTDLSGCVQAQYCAEGIGLKLLEEYKTKAKAEGKPFRIKRK